MFTLSLCVLCVARAGAAPIGLATILDGEATLLREGSRFALAEGVAVQPDDIVQTGAGGHLLRIEFVDGSSIALGPGSRALIGPRLSGTRPPAQVYLLTGWAKMSGSANGRAGVQSASVDVTATGSTAVIDIQAGSVRAFSETGDLKLAWYPPAKGTRTLKAGEFASLTGTAKQPTVATRATPEFLQGMPPAFRDSLPNRAAMFQGKSVQPRRLGALTYADAQPWLDGEPSVRHVSLRLWRTLADEPEFRHGLEDGLKSHPEWAAVLKPAARASAPTSRKQPGPMAQANAPASAPANATAPAPSPVPTLAESARTQASAPPVAAPPSRRPPQSHP
jgi:hypothetical protein